MQNITDTQRSAIAHGSAATQNSAATDHPVADGAGSVLCEDGLRRPSWAAKDPLLREYYDTEWGMPVHGEAELFERLVLEGFQSGLSWATILRRREGFRRAFAGFDPDAVAGFGAAQVEQLLEDPGIIRHRGKIEATIGNARATVALRGHDGPGTTLADLVWSYRPERTPRPHSASEVPTTSPESVALAKDLKRRGFRFVGPTTMFALMEALGVVDTHLVGSHRRSTSGVWQPDGSPARAGREPSDGR